MKSPFELLKEANVLYHGLLRAIPSQQEEIQYWSGIGFRVGNYNLVSPIKVISEILEEQQYTNLPSVKHWVKGVANIRGRLLPVVDLNQFFGLNANTNKKLVRLLVIDNSTMFIALVVSEILGIQYFDVTSYSKDTNLVLADSILPNCIQGSFIEQNTVTNQSKQWFVFNPLLLNKEASFVDVVSF